MARSNKKRSISHVMYSYVGTDAQFDEFLKMIIHDYLAVDDPYNDGQATFVDNAESVVA